ncbi:MAG: BON domain-containing protein, partial [Pyrinomonadaceae bacterium]
MMKKIRLFIRMLAVAVVVSAINVNAQNATKIAHSIDLGRQVQKSILKLPYYEVFDNIDFTVDGSTVVLTGKVRNAINKSDAEGSVKHIDGVTKVVNNIEILPVGSFDDRIRRDLLVSISRTGGLSRYLWPVNPDVRLIVERGHVTLEGSVYNTGDLTAM